LWDSFVNGFSQLLQTFYLITVWLKIPNYGIAIILFTLAVKALLFPLTAKQLRSMRALQELQPQIKEIQERYKNNPQKAQQAIMELYKKAGANPFSGCLPLLIQMPILFALFSALRKFFDPVHHPSYVDLSHAGFLWIPNLGQPDLVWLPLLVAAATFLQQYVTVLVTTGQFDSNQRMMTIMMPLFIGWLARTLPAGLSLYWVVFSLCGVLEQFFLRKQFQRGREKSLRDEVDRNRGKHSR